MAFKRPSSTWIRELQPVLSAAEVRRFSSFLTSLVKIAASAGRSDEEVLVDPDRWLTDQLRFIGWSADRLCNIVKRLKVDAAARDAFQHVLSRLWWRASCGQQL